MSVTQSSQGPSFGRPGSVQLRFPLVGRSDELASLEALLEATPREVSVALLTGEGGSGKTRVAEELAARAARRGWTVAEGRAYPVERGVPFALFSDAFLPILAGMDAGTLTVLSRGGEAELAYLFPALGAGPGSSALEGMAEPDEFRTRLFWNFVEFLKSYAKRKPVLVVLEDLQWADASSLELLHFVARHAQGQPIFFLCTYTRTERERNAELPRMERSLLSLGVARTQVLEPLTRDHVTEVVCRVFSVDADLVREFSAMLFGWTRGNPFFVEETLKSLVARGQLSNRKGTWVGWDARSFALPGSIRDVVVGRLSAFSAEAQRVAELVAVVGARASYPLLDSIAGLDGSALLAALEELVTHQLLTEHDEGGEVVYDFSHPVVRETLYGEFGLQRTRILHGAVAEALETYWGDAAIDHADELAYHFARTDATHLTQKAVTYLSAAGRRALQRHADREAVGYLQAAFERVRRGGADEHDVDDRALVVDLARAHLRLGDYEKSARHWESAVKRAAPGTAEHASALRVLGLAAFWCGRHEEALGHLRAGLESAEASGVDAEVVHLRLVRSHCLQELGRGGEALSELETALPQARALGNLELLARVHRSLALLQLWIGPPEAAEQHALQAIELARQVDDLSVEFWARWGLAVLKGMAGDTTSMADGLKEANDLAEKLRSPVLRLWTAEMSIELAYGTGDWDGGVSLGEQSIALARSMNQKPLLSRLLALTSLFYMGRGDLDRAKVLVDEACETSGMYEPGGLKDVHRIVPAYTGLAHYLVALGDYADAIAAARRGLDIAEGTGYKPWAVHRLLPIYAEACLWAGEFGEAERVGAHMRTMAERMNHRLGIAWADACDALIRWKRGDAGGATSDMRAAAERLEEIPMIPYAVRIRRQLAGRLADIGDTDAAVAELRRVHDVLAQLGAEIELEKCRIQFRELGHRPPPKGTGEGMAGLTARELEIARLVALRKSNQAIGGELGISPRTVSTHLSNVFQKLDISSRAMLGDMVREQGLLE